jgi:hypothetical protein
MEVYIIFSEEFERSIAVFSSLEKAKIYLKNKEKKYGRHTLVKSIVDGLPIKLNDYFEYISIENL